MTSDPQRARAHAYEALGGYARNISYAAVLELEGMVTPPTWRSSVTRRPWRPGSGGTSKQARPASG
jgi:hypothetical protein